MEKIERDKCPVEGNKDFSRIKSRLSGRERDSKLQLFVATLITFAGCVLLGCGFLFPPQGEIHSSVLVGFGEMLTFAGALFGIDYHYRN